MADLYDVIVLGGGPAGYVAAIKAAQLKAKVAVVEKDVLGGTCLNRGCIPTKNYLKTAEVVHEVEGAKSRGVLIENPVCSINMSAVVAGKNKVVKKLTGGVGVLLKSNGVDVYYGAGRALDAGSVSVASPDGKETVLKAKALLLAGGSETLNVPIPGADSQLVLNSTEMLDLKEIPSRLAIIGGGVIGVEMGQIFSAFGSQVTIIELADRILPFMDEEVSKLLTKTLKKGGVDVRTGVKLSKVIDKGNTLILRLEDGTEVEADKALMSIGRGPDLSCLGVLKPEMKGRSIKVNSKMETSIPGVFAPGDVNGEKMLAHAAYKMGEIAAENALGGSAEADLRYVPSVVYSHPEVGAVGLTEEEAKTRGPVSVGTFSLMANGRALASGAGEGFVKVLADPEFGEILGVHIVGLGGFRDY